MIYARVVCGIFFFIIFVGIFCYQIFIHSKPPWWQGQLVFQDNFNGGYLDFTRWNYASDFSVFPQEARKIVYYSNALNSNIQVYNGKLELSAGESARPAPGQIFRSVQIHQKTPGFTYGAFGIRAKFAQIKYLASTIRLVQSNACFHNQITIVRRPAELLLNRTKSNTLIFGAQVSLKDKLLATSANNSTAAKIVKNIAFTTSNFDLNDDYHEYGILWTPKKLQWFFDGEQYYEMQLSPKEWQIKGAESSECYNASTIFQFPMIFIIDLDVYPGFEQLNPQGPILGMSIDWIRVYQKIASTDD